MRKHSYLWKKESFAIRLPLREDVVPVRRSVRTHKAPDRLCLNVEIDPDRLSFNIEVEEHSLGDLNEPANYKAALSDPKFEKWLVAMNEEMQSINDNKVWKLVAFHQNAKVVLKCSGYTREDIWMARNTKDTFLVYGGNPEAKLQVKCYCDVGFETDRDDTKSQMCCLRLNGASLVVLEKKLSKTKLLTTAQHAKKLNI
ncbi:hypothetical protein Tco_0790897 [Tanacetum coccineum]